MTHFPLRLTKCCDWQLFGRQVSIAWWTGIYCLADRYLLLGSKYLLLGGQVSIVWQMHLQDLDTYK